MRFTHQPIQNAIIESLSYHGMCTAKQLLSDINSERKTPITLQCLYKQLGNLLQQGFIVKENGYYTFSIEWLKNIHTLSSRAYDRVITSNLYNQTYQNLKEGKKISFQSKNKFERIRKMDNIICSILFHMHKNEKGYYYGHHLIMPDKTSFNRIIDESGINLDCHIYGTSIWDTSIMKKRDTNCVKHFFVKDNIPNKNYLVLGDILFELTFESPYQSALDEATKKSDLEEWSAMREFLKKPISSESIEISYNPSKAKHIKNTIQSLKRY